MSFISSGKDSESNPAPVFYEAAFNAVRRQAGVIVVGLSCSPVSVLHSLFPGSSGPEVSLQTSPIALS